MDCLPVEGDVCECGVSSGANTFPLSDMVKTWNKKYAVQKRVYACDTFAGLPYDDQIVQEKMHRLGEFNFGNNFKIIQSQRQDLPIERVEGLVEDTLPLMLTSQSFCFVFLDMDLYKPTKFALEFFQERMNLGGIIGLHDYGWERCPGVEMAVKEVLDTKRYQQVFFKDYTIFFKRIA